MTPGAITVSLLTGGPNNARAPVTVQPGTPAYATPAGATKTWVKFRLGASPSATNLAGAPHTFTVTAEFAVAPGVFQPLTTGSVDSTWSGAGAVETPPSTCPTLGAAGTCTVTVNSATAGVGTLTLNGLLSATVTVGGSPTTFTNVNRDDDAECDRVHLADRDEDVARVRVSRSRRRPTTRWGRSTTS